MNLQTDSNGNIITLNGSALQAVGGVTPTGSISITENGTYDVTNYASADVNVSGGGGGINSIDVYGSYDWTLYCEMPQFTHFIIAPHGFAYDGGDGIILGGTEGYISAMANLGEVYNFDGLSFPVYPIIYDNNTFGYDLEAVGMILGRQPRFSSPMYTIYYW